MKNTGLIILLFLIAGWSFSCKPSAQTTSVEAITADSTLTGIERGPCFGRCPEYKAIIYVTGFAEYYGRNNNPMRGYYHARLTELQMADVKALMKKYSMESADSAYVNPYIADFPAYFLMVRDSNGSRQVLVNHEEPPANIRDFTLELDQMLPTLPWKEISRSTELE